MSALLDKLLPRPKPEPAPISPHPINTEAGWREACAGMDEMAGLEPKKGIPCPSTT